MSAPAATSARTSDGVDRRRVGRWLTTSRWSTDSTDATPGTDRAALASAEIGASDAFDRPTSTPWPPDRAAQPRRRIDPQQAAANERDPIAQPVRLVEVVRGEDDRPARPPQRLDRLADDERRLRVERRRRLVEEDDRRVVEQRPGDRELLLHALAERARNVVPPLPEREEPQVVLDPRCARAGIEPVEPAEEVEVGAGRQLVVEPGRLGQDPDPGADLLGMLGDVEAVHRGAPLARLDQRGEQPDRRRLARAVGAEQAEDLATEHLEIHVPDRPQLPELAAQTGRPEHDGIGRRHRSSLTEPADGRVGRVIRAALAHHTGLWIHARPVAPRYAVHAHRPEAKTSPGVPRPRRVPQSPRDTTVDPPRGHGARPSPDAQRRARGSARARWALAVPAPAERPTTSPVRTGPRRTSRASGRWPAPGIARTTPTSRCRSRATRPRSPALNPTGIYERDIDVPGGWAGRRIVLHVGAAESVLSSASTASRSASERIRILPPSSI